MEEVLTKKTISVFVSTNIKADMLQFAGRCLRNSSMMERILSVLKSFIDEVKFWDNSGEQLEKS